MLFSLQWLRSLGRFDLDPERVARILTDRGLTVDSVDPASAPGDVVLDIDIPANRPDCLGHFGLARELAAATGVPVKRYEPPEEVADDPAGEVARVIVEDPELCSRYTARVVRGVRVGPSPDWVVTRLESCGLRSVNNVVDASNLVLLEVGQPIHTFDLGRIPEADGRAEIRIRRARDRERLTTLDGIERVLTPEDLVIADRADAIALAGVMGGASTEIGDATRDVLIEAAWFDPLTVRRTSRRLGLRTDASHRFERGMDPEGVRRAQDLAARLLAVLAGGRVAAGCVDEYPSPRSARHLSLRPTRLDLLLGYSPAREDVVSALAAVGLEPRPEDGDAIDVTVPSWRVDLDREVDLIEEVARHLGYDRIPASMPAIGEPVEGGTTHPLEDRTRSLLAHLGFLEAFNYAMIGRAEDDPFVPGGTVAALEIDNPIAEPLTLLRRSLLPGLLRSVDTNLRRGARDVRLFEVGRVFLGRGVEAELPSEPLRAGIVWTGAGEPRHWSREDRAADLRDAGGIVEALLASLRPGAAFSRGTWLMPGLHPGQSMAWFSSDGAPLAWAGALHPELRDRMDIAPDVLLAEIDLDLTAALPDGGFRHRAVPRVPAVTRDLSLVLDDTVSYARVREILETVSPPDPVRFEVIDRYEGEQIGSGRSSLTVRVILQPQERTLTDDAVEGYRKMLVDALESETGIELRG